jgi:hypothetical protein
MVSGGDNTAIYKALYDHPDGTPFHYQQNGIINNKSPYLVIILFSDTKGVDLESISFLLHGPNSYEIISQYSQYNQIKVSNC